MPLEIGDLRALPDNVFVDFERSVLSVPLSGVVFSAAELSGFEGAFIEVINDGAAPVTLHIERSATGASPWDTIDTATFANIQPGAAKTHLLPTFAGQFFQVTGPSGATLRVTVKRYRPPFGALGLSWASVLQSLQAILAATGQIVSNETPGGAVDGFNTAFTTYYQFKPGTTHLYLNGVRQHEGVGNDYIEDVGLQSFTFTFAPISGDTLLIDYVREG